MPTSSYLTSTRNSPFLTSPSDYRKPTSLLSRSNFGEFGFRRSSLFDTLRREIEDDRAAFRSRFGVSTRAFSSTSIPSSSPFTRISVERESRKPPITGGRLRSESRGRDLSLDSGYTSSPTSKYSSDIPSSATLKNPNRLSTSSLARSVATSGADLYAKYSPTNYKPNCELSRSRSLTDSSVDSLSASNSLSNDKLGGRGSARDRSGSGLPPSSARTNGTLPAGNSAHTKDYLNNRETSPLSSTAASIKVKTCTGSSALPLPVSLAHSRCSYSNANATNNQTPNNNNTINNNRPHEPPSVRKLSVAKCASNNNNLNNNVLSDSIVVSALTKSNNNHKKATDAAKKSSGSSSSASSVGSAKSTSSKVSKVYLGPTPAARNPAENGKKPPATSLSSSDSFKRRLGVAPMSPYRNPDFLKCEYDLARSQVINSRSRSAEANNNVAARKVTPAKDTNLNKITIFGVNEPKTALTNGCKRTGGARKEDTHVDPLDDIKFIDCDDSDRKTSPETPRGSTMKELLKDTPAKPSTATLPPSASAKMLSTIYPKYNTIPNGVQFSGALIEGEFGVANKAIAEEMSSSTSSASSTSTLSSIDISAKSVSNKVLSTDGSVDSVSSLLEHSHLTRTFLIQTFRFFVVFVFSLR